MTAPQLRPYQSEALDAVWACILGEDSALCVLPTGAGKTVIISRLMERCMSVHATVRIGMVMGRVQLVEQTERQLALVIPRARIGVYCGSLGRRELGRSVTVASVHSIADIDAHALNLLIVDEVHNLDQERGNYARLIERAREKNPRLKVVGFTATPFRSSGLIYGKGMLFKRVAYRKTIPDMVAMGHLCRPRLTQGEGEFDTSGLKIRNGEYAPEDVDRLVADKDKCLAQVTDALKRLGGRQSVVWACANIEHCNLVADTLERLGERCTTVHSKLKKAPRADNLAAFMGGSFRHMSFVSVLSEGFDYPPIDAVVLMRPMRSPVLYVQTVGRGLRPWEGKPDCLVLDYGQVVRSIGPLDDPSIAKGRRQSEKERDGVLKPDDTQPMKACPQCRGFVPPATRSCPDCGHGFPFEAPVERLDARADKGSALLSSDRASLPVTQRLGPILIGPYEAKSGNACVKVKYCDLENMVRWGPSGVAEFFVTGNAWAMERLERRLEGLGIDLPHPLEEDVEFPGTFEVTTVQEGRYERVKQVRRLSHENPRREASVGFGDQAEEGLPF